MVDAVIEAVGAGVENLEPPSPIAGDAETGAPTTAEPNDPEANSGDVRGMSVRGSASCSVPLVLPPRYMKSWVVEPVPAPCSSKF
jgi:hypothetical protein